MDEAGWQLGPDGLREVFPLPHGEPGGPIGKDHVAAWAGRNQERIAVHLERYFRPSANPRAIYQGQHFEWFAGRSEPTKFTENDLLAIEALSVSVPAQTARDLLVDAGGTFRGLLSECCRLIEPHGTDVGLATCPTGWVTDDDSPFVKLYDALRPLDGVGKVVRSKLMASKFPTLIPIRDELVEELLGMKKSRDWWLPFRELLRSGSPTVEAILSGVDDSNVLDGVSTLRRLDVALWMEARSRGLGSRRTTRTD